MLKEYYRPLIESEKGILERQISEVQSGIPKKIRKTILLIFLLSGLVTIGILFPKTWLLLLLLIIAIFIFLNLYFNISDLKRLPNFLKQKRQVVETGIVQVTEILIDRYIKIENYNDEGEYFIIEHNGLLSLIGGQDFFGIKKLKSKIEQVVIMNSEKTAIYYDNVKKSGNSIEPFYTIKKSLPERLVESEIWTKLTDRGPFQGKLEDLISYIQDSKSN